MGPNKRPDAPFPIPDQAAFQSHKKKPWIRRPKPGNPRETGGGGPVVKPSPDAADVCFNELLSQTNGRSARRPGRPPWRARGWGVIIGPWSFGYRRLLARRRV